MKAEAEIRSLYKDLELIRLTGTSNTGLEGDNFNFVKGIHAAIEWMLDDNERMKTTHEQGMEVFRQMAKAICRAAEAALS